ncbi:MAG: YHS domain-containing protein, partial [Pseudomonadota bacterium]
MSVDEKSAAGKQAHQGATYYFCSNACLNKFKANPAAYVPAAAGIIPMKTAVGQSHVHAPGMAAVAPPKTKSAKDMAKDPICGMVVEKSKALKTERAGRAYYFCSAGCQRTFESPEQELKSMRTRVAIALTGVLALAILRAGAFIALAAGATLVTWAPIPQLPWFTWGMWLFILVTPVQFIGGWGFYKGTWTAIKTRSINM